MYIHFEYLSPGAISNRTESMLWIGSVSWTPLLRQDTCPLEQRIGDSFERMLWWLVLSHVVATMVQSVFHPGMLPEVSPTHHFPANQTIAVVQLPWN